MSKGNYARLKPEQIKVRRQLFEGLLREPLDFKIAYANGIIEQGLTKGPAAILFSGGKDSTVVLDLVRRMAPDTLAIFCNTTLGDPESLNFIRRMAGEHYAEATAPDPWDFWQRTGYFPIGAKRTFQRWTRAIEGLKIMPINCCYHLKEVGSNRIMKEHGTKVAFWGNRATESHRRMMHFLDHGYIFQPMQKKWFQAYPIQHFSENDVREYLRTRVPEFQQGNLFESGCRVCMTDIGRFPNNSSRLFDSDRPAWEHAMRSGFAEQILRMKGFTDITPQLIEDAIKEYPAALVKIGRKANG